MSTEDELEPGASAMASQASSGAEGQVQHAAEGQVSFGAEGQVSFGAEERVQPGAENQAPPSEDELRAAYEAELNRITSAEMIIQTAVSLINIGGRRLGLAPSGPGEPPPAGAERERDLEQVRDAIDGASALMPILERRMPGELAPLRDAIAQLQVAYAREARGASSQTSTTATSAQGSSPEQAKPVEKPAEGDGQHPPGPAQASGRLWVPGR